MTWYEKAWWGKIVGKKSDAEKTDALKDLEAIVDFLKEVKSDLQFLIPELKKLGELEKERTVASKSLLKTNLETQETIFDKVLERYEFFQTDVDISGLRLKKVAAQFLKNAKTVGLDEMVEKKKNDRQWQFSW